MYIVYMLHLMWIWYRNETFRETRCYHLCTQYNNCLPLIQSSSDSSSKYQSTDQNQTFFFSFSNSCIQSYFIISGFHNFTSDFPQKMPQFLHFFQYNAVYCITERFLSKKYPICQIQNHALWFLSSFLLIFHNPYKYELP